MPKEQLLSLMDLLFYSKNSPGWIILDIWTLESFTSVDILFSKELLNLVFCLDLKKLVKCFNRTAIFVLFTELFLLLLTASAGFYTRAALYLNYLELSMLKSALLAGTSSLLNCHKLCSCIWMIITVFNQIVNRHCNINMICFISK